MHINVYLDCKTGLPFIKHVIWRDTGKPLWQEETTSNFGKARGSKSDNCYIHMYTCTYIYYIIMSLLSSSLKKFPNTPSKQSVVLRTTQVTDVTSGVGVLAEAARKLITTSSEEESLETELQLCIEVNMQIDILYL